MLNLLNVEYFQNTVSFSELDKNSSDVAAEGAILNEMLEIVAKRQALRPSLDAAAAAAALPPLATMTPRSKDVSDVSTDEQELEEEEEEEALEDAGIERDCVAVAGRASTSSGRNSSSNRERCLNNRSISVGSGHGQGTAAVVGGGRGFAGSCSLLLGLLLLLASLYYYELLLDCFNFY